MHPFSITGSIAFGWRETKRYFWPLIGISLVYAIIVGIAGEFSERFSVFGMVANIALQVLALIGVTHISLRVIGGGAPSIGQFTERLDIFGKMLLAYVIFSLAMMIGFVLLIVPGLYILAAYGWFAYILIERNMGVKDAFMESARITEGHRMYLLAFTVVILLFNILGLIAFVVGVLVTMSVTFIASADVYRKLRDAANKPAASDAPLPPAPPAPEEAVAESVSHDSAVTTSAVSAPEEKAS